MGRCVESPVVKLNGQAPPAPRLLWEPVKKGTEDGGEILVAFELFLVSVVAYMEKNFFSYLKWHFALATRVYLYFLVLKTSFSNLIFAFLVKEGCN